MLLRPRLLHLLRAPQVNLNPSTALWALARFMRLHWLRLGDWHIELVRVVLVVPAIGALDTHPDDYRDFLRVHRAKHAATAPSLSSAISFRLLHGRLQRLVPTIRGMRHGHHTRRSAPDPLAPIDAPTWLVVRDMCSQVLELTELPPLADQRTILMTVREQWIARGWRTDEIGPRCSQFFAMRAGERVVVGIEREPTRQIRR